MFDSKIPWTYGVKGVLFPEVLLDSLKSLALNNFGIENFGLLIGTCLRDLDKESIKKVNRESKHKIHVSSIKKLKQTDEYLDWAVVTRVLDFGTGKKFGAKSNISVFGNEKEYKQGEHPYQSGEIGIIDEDRFFKALKKIERSLEAKGLNEKILSMYHTHPKDATDRLGRCSVKEMHRRITELSDLDKNCFSGNPLFTYPRGKGLFVGVFGYYYENYFLNYKMRTGKLEAEVSRYAKGEKDLVKISAFRLYKKPLRKKIEEVKIRLF